MKKRDFQSKATTELLRRLAEVCAETKEVPNITVTSKFHSSYFKLRKNGNLIKISAKQTGELSYQLMDMLETTGEEKIYYQYREGDNFEQVIGKFAADFGRLYRDFLVSGTLHGFDNISLSYGSDAGKELKEYERYILECM